MTLLNTNQCGYKPWLATLCEMGISMGVSGGGVLCVLRGCHFGKEGKIGGWGGGVTSQKKR